MPCSASQNIARRHGKPLRTIRFDPAHEGEWRFRTNAATPAKPTTLVPAGKGKRIFDGKTFAGWEGNREWFRIEDGAIVGGSLKKRIPWNECRPASD